MADTAITLITDALLDLGVLADEETPSASQSQTGLRKLNNLIDAWNIENLLIYGSQQYILPLVANQASYTIGPSGNLNIPRPSTIQQAYIRDTTLSAANQVDIPVTIFTDQQWQDVPFKGQTSTYPFNGVWFNYTSPLITAYVNPVPTTSQYSLIFWAAGELNNLAINDMITFAPGYKRALTANLALEMAASYQIEPSAVIVKIAQESKAWLKINNLQMDEMELPYGISGLGWYDIRTGYYR